MHAVEDALVVLSHSPMGVGEKQRRLNPVERLQSGPISNPKFAGQSWCFFWRPSLLGPPLLFGYLAEWAPSFVYASLTYFFPQRMHS